jgi:hypothetical protein
LQQTLDLPGDLTLDQVVAAGGIIKPAEKERNLIPVWSVVESPARPASISSTSNNPSSNHPQYLPPLNPTSKPIFLTPFLDTFQPVEVPLIQA